MAARAIIGILLGVLFAPVVYLLLVSIGDPTAFSNWFWSMTSDFNTFLSSWVNAGVNSTIAPLATTVSHPYSLILGFGPTYGILSEWIPTYAPALITWALVGAWAGAIERSAGRGLGVGIGCWLGWLIIGLLVFFIAPTIIVPLIVGFVDLLLGMLMTAIVVLVVAVIFGAMTKSEEF
ncbi:MAG: hypothetical protein HWN65_09380 [Candidatus Helarchaeota archaeon]|nr:hypothetical protein [Candidatus Helarchaeota archaeon]